MLRQEESLSISKASTWGIRRRFEQGKVALNHSRFLGYDKDEQGNLIINEKQAKIVRRIYKEFLNGKGTTHIARELEQDKVKNWEGKVKWYESTIKSMLQNEKYKGNALLQKTYTVDFLSKTRVANNGEVPKYYVEESHPAIIEPETWEAVQLEMKRRKIFCEEHNIKNLDTKIPPEIINAKSTGKVKLDTVDKKKALFKMMTPDLDEVKSLVLFLLDENEDELEQSITYLEVKVTTDKACVFGFSVIGGASAIVGAAQLAKGTGEVASGVASAPGTGAQVLS